VCNKGALWLKVRDQFKTFSKTHVSRMCSTARSADDQGIDAVKQVQSVGRDRLTITQISRERPALLTENESENVGSSMFYLNWRNLCITEAEGPLD